MYCKCATSNISLTLTILIMYYFISEKTQARLNVMGLWTPTPTSSGVGYQADFKVTVGQLTRIKKDLTMLLAFLISGCPPSALMAAWIIFTMSSLKSNCKKSTKLHVNWTVFCTAIPPTNFFKASSEHSDDCKIEPEHQLKSRKGIWLWRSKQPSTFVNWLAELLHPQPFTSADCWLVSNPLN